MDIEAQRDDAFEGEQEIELAEIPTFLHSDYYESPFAACTVCGRGLLGGAPYGIQKTFRGSECVFEMAICHGCQVEILSDYSEESRLTLAQLTREEFSPRGHAEPRCQLCPTPRRSLTRYSVMGACSGESLLWPVIYTCDQCEERIQESLSTATTDLHEEFMRDNVPGIPADLDLSPSWVL